MEQFEDYLRSRNIRLTEPRREVFKILNSYPQPLTINEIIKQCLISERTSVYRTLSLFAEYSIVEVLHIKGKERYELADPFKPHHHHLICMRCGELISLDQPKLEQLVNRIAASHRYQLTAHHIELQGVCRDCQKL